jgi:hypothetical protein
LRLCENIKEKKGIARKAGKAQRPPEVIPSSPQFLCGSAPLREEKKIKRPVILRGRLQSREAAKSLPSVKFEVGQLFGLLKLKNCVFVLKSKNELSNSKKIGSKKTYHEKIDLDYPISVYFFVGELSIQPFLIKRRSD